MKRYVKASTNSVSELAKFLEDSVNTLLTSDVTNCRYPLDDTWAVYVGWARGFDEDDEFVIHDDEYPSYVICVTIADMEDYMWTDFDWCNRPYNKETGEIWDTDNPISPDENYQQTATWLLDEYDKIVEDFGTDDDDYDDEYI